MATFFIGFLNKLLYLLSNINHNYTYMYQQYKKYVEKKCLI